VLADLAQRSVTVVEETELAARGAALQAAARHHGSPIADVQSAWELRVRATFEPQTGADAAEETRAAYARARG
jgi:glycerol kinase